MVEILPNVEVRNHLDPQADNSSDVVNGDTLIMGVIGDPIAQIRTPQLINPLFAARGANIKCVPFHVAAEDLSSAWESFKSIRNLIGLGVTVPHKTTVPALCDSLDAAAIRVGAVNVVRREADGSLRGYQFDGRGFVRGLLSQGHQPSGRNCLLVGAGGAAAGIAYALEEAGATSLQIANRNVSRAESLASRLNEDLQFEFARTSDPVPQSGDLVINATSLGMEENDPLPVDSDRIDETMLIADVVANPEVTSFLKAARDRGAMIHSGVHMIRNQIDLIAQHMLESSKWA